MTTIQKWYLLIIYFIVGIIYSFTVFDPTIKGFYVVFYVLFCTSLIFSFVGIFIMLSDSKQVANHIKYLYKEFIKIIKFYINL